MVFSSFGKNSIRLKILSIKPVFFDSMMWRFFLIPRQSLCVGDFVVYHWEDKDPLWEVEANPYPKVWILRRHRRELETDNDTEHIIQVCIQRWEIIRVAYPPTFKGENSV